MVEDYRGMSVAEAKAKAEKLKLSVEIKGSGKVVENQFPEVGEQINQSTKLVLYTQ